MITTWFDDDPLFNRYYPYYPDYQYYFENEWGMPLHCDERLFEFLSLGNFAAGLNWSLVLNKRAAFRSAFQDWDIAAVAAYDASKIIQLCQDPSIIRNQRKIQAVIHNAQLIQQIQRTQSFEAYLWQHLHYQQLVLNCQYFSDLPRTTITGDQVARQLRQIGFQFVGPVTVNAWLVNTGFITARPDHRGIIQMPSNPQAAIRSSLPTHTTPSTRSL
ncbi:DNA-3-methyladenine glycosylase I [Lactiplantibacillus sp. DA1]|uniref:DNA-3-methyladenine glycosylase I n=1 Tax=Lactiplantibacillus sp. DA1 TaxID=3079857 RepID=UPI00292A66AB|nr:DNA-3-methyladenine glycosylase I [Lactiplantibacillus sp. DA1]MDV0430416.1 DNA-3-methyladenine glycosylase I [Lactiplantibacillus sp. DA1]